MLTKKANAYNLKATTFDNTVDRTLSRLSHTVEPTQTGRLVKTGAKLPVFGLGMRFSVNLKKTG